MQDPSLRLAPYLRSSQPPAPACVPLSPHHQMDHQLRTWKGTSASLARLPEPSSHHACAARAPPSPGSAGLQKHDRAPVQPIPHRGHERVGVGHREVVLPGADVAVLLGPVSGSSSSTSASATSSRALAARNHTIPDRCGSERLLAQGPKASSAVRH